MFSFLKSLMAGIGFLVIIVISLGLIADIGYIWIATFLMLIAAAIYVTGKSKGG